MSAQDVVVRFFHDVDRQDWPAIRAALADVIHVDYTSLFGGEAEELPADDLVARWQGLLPGFDATQHLLGPLSPTPSPSSSASATTDELSVECNVRAHHRLAGVGGSADEWMVAGRYTIALLRGDARWQLSGITLHTTYESGDPSLVATATQRASGAATPS